MIRKIVRLERGGPLGAKAPFRFASHRATTLGHVVILDKNWWKLVRNSQMSQSTSVHQPESDRHTFPS